MEDLEEGGGVSLVIGDVRLWLLRVLGGDAWDAAFDTAKTFHVDIAMVFLGFYGFLTVVVLVMLLLAVNMKGFVRAMSFACVMACLVFGGSVAGLSLLDWKIAEGSKTERRGASISYRREVPDMGEAEKTLAIQRSRERAARELQDFILPEPPEPIAPKTVAKGERDADGNLLEDDLSHEAEYPQR